MNNNTLKWTTLALLPGAMLAFTSCSSTPKLEPTTTAVYEPGVPGGIIVETYRNSATVTAIDAANRKVTLVTPDGRMETFKAGPEVVNFDQIRVGDQVKATFAREIVAYLRKAGAPRTEGEAAALALAPKGAKPGIMMANTVELTAKVKSLNLKRHRATLEFPDGKSKTFDVRPDVDLTQVKLGDEVAIRATEALAISVERP